ncbi:MAG: carbon-nitrogen hydrolase [Pseudohongiellaceae bacterium]
MTESTIQAGLIQQQAWPDKKQSLQETGRLLQQLHKQSSPDLVLLQELHSTHYFCQLEDTNLFELAEPLDGPTCQQLSAWAREFQCVLVGSIFERRAPGVYHNTAVVFEKDGTLAGYYRKMHIPDDPGFYEKFYFTPGDAERINGDSGFTPVDTSAGRLGVLVCWDQWYPEAARLMALAGAELLLYPTAIGWDCSDPADEQQRQQQAWQLIQRSHAVANNLPVLAANRVGQEDHPTGQGNGISFWGSSFICGPQGEILSQAGPDQAEILCTQLDLGRTETLRRIWPYFRDRRVDAYKDILQRFLKD